MRAAQQATQQATQQVIAEHPEDIIEQLRFRRGVIIAVCPGLMHADDFLCTYPLSKYLAMIESYILGFALDELYQCPPLTQEDVSEAETHLERCLDALRADSACFSLMIHIHGWDMPRLYVADDERCGVPEVLDQLVAEMQYLWSP